MIWFIRMMMEGVLMMESKADRASRLKRESVARVEAVEPGRTARQKRAWYLRSRAANRGAIIERDGGRCQMCGGVPSAGNTVELQLDHIQPYSRGGSCVAANLQVLCSACNAYKSARPLTPERLAMVLALVAGRNVAAGIDPERLVKGPHNRGYPKASSRAQVAAHRDAVERSQVSERVKDARVVSAILDRYAADPLWDSLTYVRALGSGRIVEVVGD